MKDIYDRLHKLMLLTDGMNVGVTLRQTRNAMLERREFEIAGLLWTAIDAREKMNVAIGEAMALMQEKTDL